GAPLWTLPVLPLPLALSAGADAPPIRGGELVAGHQPPGEQLVTRAGQHPPGGSPLPPQHRPGGDGRARPRPRAPAGPPSVSTRPQPPGRVAGAGEVGQEPHASRVSIDWGSSLGWPG